MLAFMGCPLDGYPLFSATTLSLHVDYCIRRATIYIGLVVSHVYVYFNIKFIFNIIY